MTIPAISPSALPPLRRTERDHGPLTAPALRRRIAAAARSGPPAPDRTASETGVAAGERGLLGPRRMDVR